MQTVKRTPQQAALDRAASKYWANVDMLAADLRKNHVLPFCKRKKYTFCAGMGTWVFFDRNGRQVAPERLPAGLVRKLDAEVLSRQCLGSLIASDITERDL